METLTRGRLREHAAAELRAELARRRISAAELARRLGWKQSYIARRIDGRVALDLDDLEAIASELDVKVINLLPRGDNVGYAQVTDQPDAATDRSDVVTDHRSVASGTERIPAITPHPVAARPHTGGRPTHATHRPPSRPAHGPTLGPRPERPRIKRPVSATT